MPAGTITYRRRNIEEPTTAPLRTVLIAEGLADFSRVFTAKAYEQGQAAEYPKEHPLEIRKLVHAGGEELGSWRWTISHSLAGHAAPLFTLAIAGGEIHVYHGANMKQAITYLPQTERGGSSRSFIYDGVRFTWRRRKSLTSGWFTLVHDISVPAVSGVSQEDEPQCPVIAEYRPHALRADTVRVWREDAVPLPLIVLTSLAVDATKMDFGFA